MKSSETQDGRLEIRGDRTGEGAEALIVEGCPFRGPCALATCMRCRDFTGLETDAAGAPTRVLCRKAEAAPNEAFPLLERKVRAGDGTHWTVTAYGRERHDGSFDGWLVWRSQDGAVNRCGGCETNERSREGLRVWAEALSAWSSRGLMLARAALDED